MLSIMNILNKIGRYRVLVIVLSMLIFMNMYAAIDENVLLFRVAKLVVVPTLLILYFNKLKYMANVFFFTFLIFFLGDVMDVFNFSPLSIQLSMTLYTSSYLLLIFVLLGKLKRIKFEGLVSLYLILVFLLNSYFLYVFFDVVQNSLLDRLNVALIVARGISLLFMTFIAFAVYLSSESRQSIIFLTMAFCFIFSDVLYYVNHLYVYYWIFELLDKILHLIGSALFFVYVTNHHRKSKRKAYNKIDYFEKSENITA